MLAFGYVGNNTSDENNVQEGFLPIGLLGMIMMRILILQIKVHIQNEICL